MSILKSFAAELLAVPYRLRFGHIGRRPRLFFPVVGFRRGQDSVGGQRVGGIVCGAVSRPRGRMEIGSKCELSSFARLEADVGHIMLGEQCSVNSFCVLNGYGGITIGIVLELHLIPSYYRPAISMKARAFRYIHRECWQRKRSLATMFGSVHIVSLSVGRESARTASLALGPLCWRISRPMQSRLVCPRG